MGVCFPQAIGQAPRGNAFVSQQINFDRCQVCVCGGQCGLSKYGYTNGDGGYSRIDI